MKECDIVQDLLIGYTDKTLKEGSKEFVEAHLNECINCQKIFDEIKNDNIKEDENIEIDYLKKINKKNNKKNIYIILLIIFAIIIVAFNAIVFIIYYNTDTGIEVFLKDDITNEQLEKIEDIIKKSFYEYRYKTKEEALEEFKERISGDNPQILDGYEGDSNIFPASFVIKTKWGKGEELISSLERLDGVKKISSSININPYELFCAKVMQVVNEIF